MTENRGLWATWKLAKSEREASVNGGTVTTVLFIIAAILAMLPEGVSLASKGAARLLATMHPSAWTWQGRDFGDREFVAEGDGKASPQE
jgi:hypothetical protein